MRAVRKESRFWGGRWRGLGGVDVVVRLGSEFARVRCYHTPESGGIVGCTRDKVGEAAWRSQAGRY